jgi:ribosome-binding ATPase YchF (GTP1/OBG family)
LVLVKGDRQTGSQVSPTTHRILVLGKEIARWDLKITKKKRERNIERKKKEKKRRKREQKKKKKRARSLDEWRLSKLGRQKGKFFFTKLTMQNIEEFCFVSIVKRGHMLITNF